MANINNFNKLAYSDRYLKEGDVSKLSFNEIKKENNYEEQMFEYVESKKTKSEEFPELDLPLNKGKDQIISFLKNINIDETNLNEKNKKYASVLILISVYHKFRYILDKLRNKEFNEILELKDHLETNGIISQEFFVQVRLFNEHFIQATEEPNLSTLNPVFAYFYLCKIKDDNDKQFWKGKHTSLAFEIFLFTIIDPFLKCNPFLKDQQILDEKTKVGTIIKLVKKFYKTLYSLFCIGTFKEEEIYDLKEIDDTISINSEPKKIEDIGSSSSRSAAGASDASEMLQQQKQQPSHQRSSSLTSSSTDTRPPEHPSSSLTTSITHTRPPEHPSSSHTSSITHTRPPEHPSSSLTPSSTPNRPLGQPSSSLTSSITHTRPPEHPSSSLTPSSTPNRPLGQPSSGSSEQVSRRDPQKPSSVPSHSNPTEKKRTIKIPSFEERCAELRVTPEEGVQLLNKYKRDFWGDSPAPSASSSSSSSSSLNTDGVSSNLRGLQRYNHVPSSPSRKVITNKEGSLSDDNKLSPPPPYRGLLRLNSDSQPSSSGNESNNKEGSLSDHNKLPPPPLHGKLSRLISVSQPSSSVNESINKEGSLLENNIGHSSSSTSVTQEAPLNNRQNKSNPEAVHSNKTSTEQVKITKPDELIIASTEMNSGNGKPSEIEGPSEAEKSGIIDSDKKSDKVPLDYLENLQKMLNTYLDPESIGHVLKIDKQQIDNTLPDVSLKSSYGMANKDKNERALLKGKEGGGPRYIQITSSERRDDLFLKEDLDPKPTLYQEIQDKQGLIYQSIKEPEQKELIRYYFTSLSKTGENNNPIIFENSSNKDSKYYYIFLEDINDSSELIKKFSSLRQKKYSIPTDISDNQSQQDVSALVNFGKKLYNNLINKVRRDNVGLHKGGVRYKTRKLSRKKSAPIINKHQSQKKKSRKNVINLK